MRHSRFALCALFLLLASVAVHADSISVFQITSASIFFLPTSGGMAFEFNGPRIAISGVGGFDCPSGWCILSTLVAEGTPIDFGKFFPAEGPNTVIQIDGKTYIGPQDNLNPWTMNPFTALFAPDDGSPAILNGNGLIPGSVATASGTLQFQIKVPVGSLNLIWIQSAENPSYYSFITGNFLAATSPVPEPSSVVLLATGLAGILSTLKFRQRH